MTQGPVPPLRTDQRIPEARKWGFTIHDVPTSCNGRCWSLLGGFSRRSTNMRYMRYRIKCHETGSKFLESGFGAATRLVLRTMIMIHIYYQRNRCLWPKTRERCWLWWPS